MSLEITEIRIKLTGDPGNKLMAFCSVTLANAFVVRDLKVIDGVRGPFVAMPSRKLADRCGSCGHKNNLRAGFCNQCGVRLDPERGERDERGRVRLHADLAHPINSHCRLALHNAIVAAYAEEVEQSKKAGYKPTSFDDFEGDDFIDDDDLAALLPPTKTSRAAERPRSMQESAPDDGTAAEQSGG